MPRPREGRESPKAKESCKTNLRAQGAAAAKLPLITVEICGGCSGAVAVD